jgi:transposase
MRFVAVKSQEQQDMLALHRVRSLLIRERTALMNQMRGLLAEYGIVVAQGAVPLRRALALILEEQDNGISDLLRELLVEMSERQRLLDDRLKRYDQEHFQTARKRRHETQANFAKRLLVATSTLIRMEARDPGVSIGTWATALWALGMLAQFRRLAYPDDDTLGKALEIRRLPKSVRMAKGGEQDEF